MGTFRRAYSTWSVFPRAFRASRRGKRGFLAYAPCRVGVAAVFAALALTGCRTPQPGAGGETPSAVTPTPSPPGPTHTTPAWADEKGRWVDEWEDAHPAERGRYEWVVGTSRSVDSREEDALAAKSASQDAVFHLMRLLGVRLKMEAVSGDVWRTTDGGNLVSAMYRKALMTEMARHTVNFEERQRSWTRQVVMEEEHRRVYHVLKVLFRLDKARFRGQNLLAKAQEGFEKGVKTDDRLNESTRKEIIREVRALLADAAKRRPDLAGKGVVPRTSRALDPAAPRRSSVGVAAASAGKAPALPAGCILWTRPKRIPLWHTDFGAWRRTMGVRSDERFVKAGGEGYTEDAARKDALTNARASLPVADRDRSRVIQLPKYEFARKWRKDCKPKQYEVIALFQVTGIPRFEWVKPDPPPKWYTDLTAWGPGEPKLRGKPLKAVTGQGPDEAAAGVDALAKALPAFGLDANDGGRLRPHGRFVRKWRKEFKTTNRFEVTILYERLPAEKFDWKKPTPPPLWYENLEEWLKKNPAYDKSTLRIVTGQGPTEKAARQDAFRQGLEKFRLDPEDQDLLKARGQYVRKWKKRYKAGNPYEVIVIYYFGERTPNPKRCLLVVSEISLGNATNGAGLRSALSEALTKKGMTLVPYPGKPAGVDDAKIRRLARRRGAGRILIARSIAEFSSKTPLGYCCKADLGLRLFDTTKKDVIWETSVREKGHSLVSREKASADALRDAAKEGSGKIRTAGVFSR